jgi:hypothetical protein
MKTVVRIAVALLLAFTLSSPVIAQDPAKSNFQPIAQDRDDREKSERNERHPHIRGAIRELEEAKRELQAAAHDFGGHRADALRACDEAIHQLQLAQQYDKK